MRVSEAGLLGPGVAPGCGLLIGIERERRILRPAGDRYRKGDSHGWENLHGERVNTSVLHCGTGGAGDPFRKIDVWIRQSHPVRELVQELVHRMPGAVRYLLRGLGSDSAVTEPASYLLFDSSFCGKLIELGRLNVTAERERFAAFFEVRPAQQAAPVIG